MGCDWKFIASCYLRVPARKKEREGGRKEAMNEKVKGNAVD